MPSRNTASPTPGTAREGWRADPDVALEEEHFPGGNFQQGQPQIVPPRLYEELVGVDDPAAVSKLLPFQGGPEEFSHPDHFPPVRVHQLADDSQLGSNVSIRLPRERVGTDFDSEGQPDLARDLSPGPEYVHVGAQLVPFQALVLGWSQLDFTVEERLDEFLLGAETARRPGERARHQ